MSHCELLERQDQRVGNRSTQQVSWTSVVPLRSVDLQIEREDADRLAMLNALWDIWDEPNGA